MNVIDQIFAKISNLEGMTRSTPEEIAIMRQEYPSVPDVYCEFMAVVGWGDIGGMMIYSGLSDSDDFLAAPDPKIVLFGDNWQGACYGFDLGRGVKLIEITEEGDIEDEEDTFIELLTGYSS